MKDIKNQMVLKAVLLLRKSNRYESKEDQIEMAKTLTIDELQDWIEYLKDNRPEWEKRGFSSENAYLEYLADEDWAYEKKRESYSPSCTNGDYSPSCPWNAPGMSVHDFI